MFQNHLSLALRGLLRRKMLAAINIIGLSLGLACCVVIVLFIKDELSFDRFHTNAPNLARITCRPLDKLGVGHTMGIASMVQGPAFKEEIPAIRDFVRVRERDALLKIGAKTFNEKATWVDDNFFTVFTFPLLSGNPSTVLSGAYSVVLSEETAQKYFGTTNVVGKSIEIEERNSFQTYVVSGVAKNPPQNSSITFGIVLSFSTFAAKNPDPTWMTLSYPTFLLLREGADVQEITATMARVFATKAKTEMESERKHGWDGQFIWSVQPLTEMHLSTEVNIGIANAGNPLYSKVLGAIALGILLLACINFVSLSIAQSSRRAREIAIRKTIGSRRSQIIAQFLTESFLQTSIAFAVALGIAELILPMFNIVAGKHFQLVSMLDAPLLLALGLLFFVTGLAAGVYPALVVSRFEASQTLSARSPMVRKSAVARVLIVVQFALTIFLLIGTITLSKQFSFLTTKDLGYDSSNLVAISLPEADNLPRQAMLKAEFAKIAGVENLTPRTEWWFGTNSKVNGKEIAISYEHIDHDFLKTMNCRLAAGRNFSQELRGDSTDAVLVNEAYVRAAGWQDAIGKRIDFFNGKARNVTVVGVVKDYHYESLQYPIRPQLFIYGSELPFGKLLLRINPANKLQTLAAIENAYQRLVPLRPFNYTFLDEENRRQYSNSEHWRNMIALASAFALGISVMGLLGLTLLATEQRTKEIGIRKVLGASVGNIISLVGREFLVLVAIAFILATPLAYWSATNWLQDYAYRIELDATLALLAGSIALATAALTVGSQAWRAAEANPVQSLRSE